MNEIVDPGLILLVDKPLTWTSFDVVKKLRYGLKVKKIGHAGTLDPLATGLLIICTGKSTKKIPDLVGLDKGYSGTIMIGATTPSYDLETEADQKFSVDHISKESLEEARLSFLGIQNQTPPIFSAVKVKGERSYKKARKGEEVKLEPREIEIKELEIDSSGFPEIKFSMLCSKGTYVRSFAHDFGKQLGSGAHLSSLKRTQIGSFKLEDALSIEETLERYRPNEDS